MATTYTYLDDEKPETVRPFIEEVKRHQKGLVINLKSPKDFRKQMSLFAEDTFDGLILDLRLDQFVDWEAKPKDAERADYRATTLAQEIRTRATEGTFKECPVVLWSTDQRLRRSYTRDDTGHDLFDLKCIKSDFKKDEVAKQTAERLVSLVSGYKHIIEVRAANKRYKTQFHRFLGFDEDPGFIDPRILGRFETREGTIPAHEFARFIIYDVLEPSGPLIDENILRVRLGLDVEASSSFESLKERVLSKAAYQGSFSDGWPRWWSHLVEEWWRSLKSSPPPLRTVPASERVKILKKETGLRNLASAKPISQAYSDKFWTLCRATGRPLDPRDGFIVQSANYRPWQDRSYVSLAASLDGSMEESSLIVDRLDRERFNKARSRVSP